MKLYLHTRAVSQRDVFAERQQHGHHVFGHRLGIGTRLMQHQHPGLLHAATSTVS